jgi:hypothetical protein
VVSFKSRPLYPRHPLIGGWVDPRTGLDDVERRKALLLPGLYIALTIAFPNRFKCVNTVMRKKNNDKYLDLKRDGIRMYCGNFTVNRSPLYIHRLILFEWFS